jgi:hypothetical protein
MRRHLQRKFKFQPRHDQLESRQLLSTVYSTNWSGYGAATNLSTPATGSVTAVSGSWVVPTVTGPRRGTDYSSAWVGIDGLSDDTVEQIGTEQDVSNGSAHYDAWWEMYSSGIGQPEQVISGFTIKPGDSISASVQYTGSGNFVLTITDSTSKKSFATTQNTSATQSPTASQNSAEWIVEAPTVGGRQASVADFGTITFTNASATINSVAGPINDSLWQNEAIDMITSRGSLLDTTSALNSAGTGFSVTYDGSSSLQSGGGGRFGGAIQPRTGGTNGVSPAPPTGQATAVVFYGVVPTDARKADSPGS